MTECTNCQEVGHKIDEVLRELAEIKEAFPDGVAKHRAAHEAMIATKSAEEMFWRELKLDLAKKGTWGLLVILVGLVLVGLSVKFGITFTKGP